MGRITIKDIAKLLSVNPSTVSRALKDHPDIGKAMKEKVQQVAKDLGYQPNYQAIHFRQKKSRLIALILPDMGMFFFPDVIRAIEEVVKKNGYTLVIFPSKESFEQEKDSAAICQRFGVDGLLVCLTRASADATVVINDFKAAFTAIHHLAKKRYKRIGGIFGHVNLAITQQRKAGFKAALEKHQLAYYEDFCMYANTIKEVKEQLLPLLQQIEKPDAVFTMTDEVLAGAIQTINEQGLSIPEDIALISISNGHFPYYLHPKVTHIKHSGYSVGKMAADLLFDLIDNGENVINRQLEIETYLVELDSC